MVERSGRRFPAVCAPAPSTRCPETCGPAVVAGTTDGGWPAGPGRTAALPGFGIVCRRPSSRCLASPERMSREETVSESDGTLPDQTISHKRWHPDAIKALRLRLGLTQGELAERLGVERPTVSNWETGKNAPAELNEALLDSLGAPPTVGGHARIGVTATGGLDVPKPPPTKGESHVTLEMAGNAAGTVTDPRQSLLYWLGRLEEAGSILEDAAAHHGRIRAEMAQALATPIAKREGMDEVGHRFREGYAPGDTTQPETAAK